MGGEHVGNFVGRISISLGLEEIEILLNWYACKEGNCYNDCHDDELQNVLDLHKRVLLTRKEREERSEWQKCASSR